jgi:hypothetical protein
VRRNAFFATWYAFPCIVIQFEKNVPVQRVRLESNAKNFGDARDDGEPHTSQPPKFRVPSLIALFATRSRLARALSRHFS